MRSPVRCAVSRAAAEQAAVRSPVHGPVIRAAAKSACMQYASTTTYFLTVLARAAHARLDRLEGLVHLRLIAVLLNMVRLQLRAGAALPHVTRSGRCAARAPGPPGGPGASAQVCVAPKLAAICSCKLVLLFRV